jgi:hypothetical protein
VVVVVQPGVEVSLQRLDALVEPGAIRIGSPIPLGANATVAEVPEPGISGRSDSSPRLSGAYILLHRRRWRCGRPRRIRADAPTKRTQDMQQYRVARARNPFCSSRLGSTSVRTEATALASDADAVAMNGWSIYIVDLCEERR